VSWAVSERGQAARATKCHRHPLGNQSAAPIGLPARSCDSSPWASASLQRRARGDRFASRKDHRGTLHLHGTVWWSIASPPPLLPALPSGSAQACSRAIGRTARSFRRAAAPPAPATPDGRATSRRGGRPSLRGGPKHSPVLVKAQARHRGGSLDRIRPAYPSPLFSAASHHREGIARPRDSPLDVPALVVFSGSLARSTDVRGPIGKTGASGSNPRASPRNASSHSAVIVVRKPNRHAPGPRVIL
jgi:hypothetical protein